MNAAFYDLLYWNGRSDSLWSQAAAVSESGVSMNGNRLNTFWRSSTGTRLYNDLFKDTPLPTLRCARPGRGDDGDGGGPDCDPTLVVGECKRNAGICPTVVENSGACWPLFPLHGRPGRRAGCETRTPAKPAELTATRTTAWRRASGDGGQLISDVVTQVLVNFGKAIAAYETSW